MLGDCFPPTPSVSGLSLVAVPSVQFVDGRRPCVSGAQIQQEVRVGGGQEEADAPGKVRPHPSGPSAFFHLHGEISQEGQALLVSAAGRVRLGQAQG